ncbi:hypothetical protein L204_103954 [Cryptococcus depauperatus]|nr:hypothetical protein L204_03108 [Cryptococcus depauperatus CBS 7855]
MARGHSSSIASTFSSAPVLINPSSPLAEVNSSIAPNKVRRRPTLRFASPLFFLAIADAVHTTCQATNTSTGLPQPIVAAGISRALILVFVGCTKRWRARGGWIAAGSGASLFLAVWEWCILVLSRNADSKDGKGKVEFSLMLFLVIFAGIGVFEYLVFLFLLRLSPPTHRTHPLALRLPQTHVQEASPFAFQSEDAVMTPGSTRDPRMHRRKVSNVSRLTIRSDWTTEGDSEDIFGMEGEGNDDESSNEAHDNDGRSVLDGYGYDENDGGSEEHDDYDASSISSSSIIDLPPPTSPLALSLPPAFNIASRLDTLGSSPVFGSLVRRTKSARLLGKSWSSNTQMGISREAESSQGGNLSAAPREEHVAEGYGTFHHR